MAVDQMAARAFSQQQRKHFQLAQLLNPRQVTHVRPQQLMTARVLPAARETGIALEERFCNRRQPPLRPRRRTHQLWQCGRINRILKKLN